MSGLSPLAAETYERVQPKLPGETGILDAEPSTKGQIKDEAGDAELQGAQAAKLNTVLLKELTGLAFLESPAEVQPNGLAGVEGVTASGSLGVLAGEAFAQEVASQYLWQELTLRKLNALNRDTVAFLRASGFPVVDVIIPEQDITAGTVQLIVLKGRVGEVNITGNQYFDSGFLASQVEIQPGTVVTSDSVREDLNWINRNPFRNVNLLYSRGSQTGTTDLTFQVEDRRPFRVYAGYENSGTDSTDRDRIIGGFNWGNAFGLDHQLNYQYSTAPSTSDFYAHSGSYVAPLPWRHILSFYGAYSNSTAEITSGVIAAEGESYTLGVRYTVPLKSTEVFNHELFGGFEYKYSENSLIFGGIGLPETKTEIGQFNFGYSAGLQDKWGFTSLNATLYHSPGDLFSHNDDEDFSAVLFDGQAEYTYGRIVLERTTRLPHDFSLLTSITGQLSGENLLVSEQLGAGGYATVRGYDERVANAEEGFITTVELRTPTLTVTGQEIFGAKLPGDQLQLLAFWDYANLDRKNPDPASPAPEDFSLSAGGVGLRYSLTEHFSLRFDYGWQLEDSEVGEKGDSRGHVGVVFSY
jgi:hemolysin activation/secretion protein